VPCAGLGRGAGGESGQVIAGRGVEGVAVQAGQQPPQGAGGQLGGAGQPGAGQDAGVVSVDGSGDRRQGGGPAEYGEQGECQQRAQPVAASPAAARVWQGVQDLDQRGQLVQVGDEVGGGGVLPVAGEHADRG
jgi:hypothetical protein